MYDGGILGRISEPLNFLKFLFIVCKCPHIRQSPPPPSSGKYLYKACLTLCIIHTHIRDDELENKFLSYTQINMVFVTDSDVQNMECQLLPISNYGCPHTAH